jgi:uncharacterized protein
VKCDGAVPLNFVLKVASRCNLNCSYCYVYNRGDSSWRKRPKLMPDEVYLATLERIRRHCEQSGQQTAQIAFHGGEPCLAGPDRLDWWCTTAEDVLSSTVDLRFAIQTNGTLLDERWTRVFRTHRFEVGVSMDGPREIHDRERVTHAGRGSYDAVARGLGLLRDGGVPFGVLAVVPLGADGIEVHRHFLGLGVEWIDYLLPQLTYETVGPVRAEYGPTPGADFLLPILEHWWADESVRVRIRLMWTMARLILGGESRLDMLGNPPLRYLFVEGDGSIEGLDVLRVCEHGLADTGLNVRSHNFADVASLDELHSQAIFTGVPLPSGCRACPEAATCGGGYLSHRYSRARGFDNPSVWCADLLLLFGRLRELLCVPVEQTQRRRHVLAQMRAEREDQLARPR